MNIDFLFNLRNGIKLRNIEKTSKLVPVTVIILLYLFSNLTKKFNGLLTLYIPLIG